MAPYNGTLSINPLEGNSVSTKFSISANNYKDKYSK